MRKIIQQLLLICHILKKWRYVLPTFQNITQIVRNKIFLMIPNRELLLKKEKGITLAKGITSKHDGDFYCLSYLDYFETKKQTYVT